MLIVYELTPAHMYIYSDNFFIVIGKNIDIVSL